MEQMMELKLSGCEVKAQPHIESRVKLLKKQYDAIAEMLGPNFSGFGWNERQKCFHCSKDVFDDWVKSHPSAKGLRNKSFPYLDEMAMIFGKDRANGLRAEGPDDMAEKIDMETNNGMWDDFSDCYVSHPPEEVNRPQTGVDEVDSMTMDELGSCIPT
ncbi:uncharacterized protein LOC120077046 [Benincasa hispida]|uniref:uncharacterized protein LOC120077046 n=1 Tax=Benincasa hispida TaxID=102211 RepID=UPI001900ECE5|nr:uncharacterized protein LOC120077046 [Benincasa hispida]